MARTKPTQLRRQALTFADAIQRIIGQAIGHGYRDGREGKENPDKECKAFGDTLINKLRSSCTEWAEEIIGEDAKGKFCSSNCDKRRAEGFLCYHDLINQEHEEQRKRLRKALVISMEIIPHRQSENTKKPRRVD
jgi:hypothetical protein